MIEKFLDTKIGRIIISIIWGLGIACLFKRVCKGKNCVVVKGPDPEKLKGKIFKYNDDCFKYNTYSVSCKREGNIETFSNKKKH